MELIEEDLLTKFGKFLEKCSHSICLNFRFYLLFVIN